MDNPDFLFHQDQEVRQKKAQLNYEAKKKQLNDKIRLITLPKSYLIEKDREVYKGILRKEEVETGQPNIVSQI